MGAIISYNESNFLAEVNKTFDCIFSVEKRRNVERRQIYYTLQQKKFMFDYYC